MERLTQEQIDALDIAYDFGWPHCYDETIELADQARAIIKAQAARQDALDEVIAAAKLIDQWQFGEPRSEFRGYLASLITRLHQGLAALEGR